jgi:hypothetical protein
MKLNALGCLRSLIPVTFALLVLPSAARAQMDTQMDTRGSSLEIFSGYFVGYSSSGGFNAQTDLVGARGSYRFSRTWAVEASATRTHDFFVAWDYELSAKAYLFQRERFGVFALAGVGDRRISFDGESGNFKMVHAAIGADIALYGHTYLRPEIRARWPKDFLSDRNRTTDYTLGFGWHF